MAKNRTNLPQLDFDSSGSAIVRFFGGMAESSIHYANAKVPMIRMVCPESVVSDGTEKCRLCESKLQSTQRMLSIGWDCNRNRWAVYLAVPAVFHEISSQIKKCGVTPQMIVSGDGPDVILTRLGIKTEVAVDQRTVGRTRASDPPPIEDVLRSMAKNSVWKKFGTTAELEAAFPRKSSTASRDRFV